MDVLSLAIGQSPMPNDRGMDLLLRRGDIVLACFGLFIVVVDSGGGDGVDRNRTCA